MARAKRACSLADRRRRRRRPGRPRGRTGSRAGTRRCWSRRATQPGAKTSPSLGDGGDALTARDERERVLALATRATRSRSCSTAGRTVAGASTTSRAQTAEPVERGPRWGPTRRAVSPTSRVAWTVVVLAQRGRRARAACCAEPTASASEAQPRAAATAPSWPAGHLEQGRDRADDAVARRPRRRAAPRRRPCGAGSARAPRRGRRPTSGRARPRARRSRARRCVRLDGGELLGGGLVGAVETLLALLVVGDGALEPRELPLGLGRARVRGLDDPAEAADLGLPRLDAAAACTDLAGELGQPLATVGGSAGQTGQALLLRGIRALGLLAGGDGGGELLGGRRRPRRRASARPRVPGRPAPAAPRGRVRSSSRRRRPG